MASTVKILTALAAVAALPPDTPVPISPRAEAMPARKLNMKAGQVWDLEDTLHSLLLSSANDAALALAERVAGDAESFGDTLDAVAGDLGLEDSPVLRDPSGLDDEYSIGGGNHLSARDLAIATRALLADERLAPIVATPVYSFTGGDGIPHRLGNHNRLLKTYPGAIGVKTGYTKRSGHCLVAAATRDGRTIIAVVLDAVDPYGSATALLDRGFAGGPRGTGDVLPAVAPVEGKPGPAGRERHETAAARSAVVEPDVGAPIAAARSTASTASWWRGLIAIAAIVAALVVGLRARVHIRRWRRRRKRRHARVRPHPNRRPDPTLTPEYRPRADVADRFQALIESEKRGAPNGR